MGHNYMGHNYIPAIFEGALPGVASLAHVLAFTVHLTIDDLCGHVYEHACV